MAFSNASGVAGAAYTNRIDAQNPDHTDKDWVPVGKVSVQKGNKLNDSLVLPGAR